MSRTQFPAVRRAAVHLGLLTALAVTGITLAACGESVEALAVNDVATDPTAYSGDIVVVGVVQEVDSAASSIVLIDEQEYETCGLFPCAGAGLMPLYLPTGGDKTESGAEYVGTLPDLEQTVVVYGRITGSGSDVSFDVDRIESSGKTLIEKK